VHTKVYSRVKVEDSKFLQHVSSRSPLGLSSCFPHPLLTRMIVNCSVS